MRWTIPNTLTVLRLFAAPGVPVMFLYFHRPWADWFALGLFVVASLTDWIDGYLARLWGQESKFGAMLDPIADKAMVVIALVVLTGYSGMNPWLILPATVILFREVFVSGLREFLGDKSAYLKVTKSPSGRPRCRCSPSRSLFPRHRPRPMSRTRGWQVEALVGQFGHPGRPRADLDRGGADAGHRHRLFRQGPAASEERGEVSDRRSLFRLGARADRPAEGAVSTRGAPPWPTWSPNCAPREDRYAAAFADLSALRVALDQELSDFDAPLAGVREVAFFPPMTGG